MAISVQPVDGLINRLLQQNSRSSSAAERRFESHQSKQDQLSISIRAQSQSDLASAAAQQQNKPGGKALESHLLNLYKINDSFGV